MTDDEGEINALLGQTVAGKYRVESVLGRGGMGAVYAATHLGINKRVALKFLDREAARDEDSVARFQREAEAASAVESAHIVQIFDSGTHDRQPYLVMELLSGEDLRTRLKRDKQLSIPDAVHVIAQVLRALARAHAAGIVHRDLKPDNVFLCRRDDDPMFVKIVDFGISKDARHKATNNTLTRRGTVLGTAFYMSPEQAQAFPDIDGRSDLFSLGAILFEALAGTPPHTGDAYEAILINICTKDAPNVQSLAPEVPDALARVIAKALSRDRTERYEDANE
ncbi:MAG TPA: serine/threonine-protein kinase, partial [Polyangiaceae bacterium]|nr:serine/threonine-protein kinase [Polyangiaceae bacterium]